MTYLWYFRFAYTHRQPFSNELQITKGKYCYCLFYLWSKEMFNYYIYNFSSTFSNESEIVQQQKFELIRSLCCLEDLPVSISTQAKNSK